MFNKKRKPHKLKNSYGSLLFQLFITIVGFSSVIFFVWEDVDSAIIIGGIMGIALAFITRFFIIYKRNKKNKEKKIIYLKWFYLYGNYWHWKSIY